MLLEIDKKEGIYINVQQVVWATLFQTEDGWTVTFKLTNDEVRQSQFFVGRGEAQNLVERFTKR
jgi:hypothetical protein